MAHSNFDKKDINASRDRVLATLEASGLNPKSTIVLGGGALALNGIRLAHDVDVMVASHDFSQIINAWQLPSATQVRRKPGTPRPWLRTIEPVVSGSEELYNMDITFPMKSLRPEDAFTKRLFLERHALQDSDGWKYLSLEALVAVLKLRNDHRAKKDIAVIHAWRETIGAGASQASRHDYSVLSAAIGSSLAALRLGK